MKITFVVSELQKQLSLLGGVVARKSEEALYSNVRLFTDGGIVHAQGIDIDTTLTLKLPGAKADSDVNVLLSFTVINSIVQKLKTKEVSLAFKTEQDGLLTAGSFRSKLRGSPTDKFTDLPLVHGIGEKPALGGYTFGLPGLKEQIEQVDFAVPPPDGKFVVPSALLVSTSESLSVVATDGKMMGISTVASNLGEFSFTLPKPALDNLKKLSGGTTVTISETEGAFYFQTETELLTYNKTHAEFPPYTRIIPTIGSHTTTIVLADKDAAFNALELLQQQADKEMPGLKFQISANGTNLELTSSLTEKSATGDSFMDMADNNLAVTSTGAASTFKLDSKRLKEFIARATFPATLYVKSSSSVIDFHSNGGTPEKPVYRFLQMPMRLEDAGPSSVPMPPKE